MTAWIRDGMEIENLATEAEPSLAEIAALEDKVKECGRLLLRMGGDLMEEGRRRQAIEAPDLAVYPAARLATPGTRPRPVHGRCV